MKKNKGKIVIGVLGAVAVVVVLVALMTVKPSPAVASQEETGSGAPSGWHFTLNILGKDWGDDKDPVGCGEGHRIFVKLGDPPATGKAPKTTRIYLIEGPDFRVLDCDGTDGRAEFQLPDPNGGTERCTAYSVYVRALGKPGGKAVMTTCATDPCTGEEICSEESVVIERKKGKSKFVNVSKELLTICAYICFERDPDTGECLDGDWMRLYLFDPLLQDYLWKYDNNGLKHAQLRFYPKETCYSADDWDCTGPAPD